MRKQLNEPKPNLFIVNYLNYYEYYSNYDVHRVYIM